MLRTAALHDPSTDNPPEACMPRWPVALVVVLASLFAAPPAWCTWQVFGAVDGLPATSVTSIAIDSTGSYWFGTWNGGVARFDGARWTTFSRAAGVADSTMSRV